jgi:hypothetical protein
LGMGSERVSEAGSQPAEGLSHSLLLSQQNTPRERTNSTLFEEMVPRESVIRWYTPIFVLGAIGCLISPFINFAPYSSILLLTLGAITPTQLRTAVVTTGGLCCLFASLYPAAKRFKKTIYDDRVEQLRSMLTEINNARKSFIETVKDVKNFSPSNMFSKLGTWLFEWWGLLFVIVACSIMLLSKYFKWDISSRFYRKNEKHGKKFEASVFISKSLFFTFLDGFATVMLLIGGVEIGFVESTRYYGAAKTVLSALFGSKTVMGTEKAPNPFGRQSDDPLEVVKESFDLNTGARIKPEEVMVKRQRMALIAVSLTSVLSAIIVFTIYHFMVRPAVKKHLSKKTEGKIEEDYDDIEFERLTKDHVINQYDPSIRRYVQNQFGSEGYYKTLHKQEGDFADYDQNNYVIKKQPPGYSGPDQYQKILVREKKHQSKSVRLCMECLKQPAWKNSLFCSACIKPKVNDVLASQRLAIQAVNATTDRKLEALLLPNDKQPIATSRVEPRLQFCCFDCGSPITIKRFKVCEQYNLKNGFERKSLQNILCQKCASKRKHKNDSDTNTEESDDNSEPATFFGPLRDVPTVVPLPTVAPPSIPLPTPAPPKTAPQVTPPVVPPKPEKKQKKTEALLGKVVNTGKFHPYVAKVTSTEGSLTKYTNGIQVGSTLWMTAHGICGISEMKTSVTSAIIGDCFTDPQEDAAVGKLPNTVPMSKSPHTRMPEAGEEVFMLSRLSDNVGVVPNYGRIISVPDRTHSIPSEDGFSGSPIFAVSDGALIGLHHATELVKNPKENYYIPCSVFVGLEARAKAQPPKKV